MKTFIARRWTSALADDSPTYPYDPKELASPEQVAATFVKLCKEKSGTDPTNLKLQKLVYIANGFSLAIQDKPIHNDDTHAWTFGPVSKRLYDSLKHYGRSGVTLITDASGSPIEPLNAGSREFKIVEAVFDEFGSLPAGKLVDITHKPGTPWDATWQSSPYSVIENSLTSFYYKSLAKSESLATSERSQRQRFRERFGPNDTGLRGKGKEKRPDKDQGVQKNT